MTQFFTADQHFGHARIQYFEEKTRGHFEDVRDMDEFMIQMWNSKVKKDDVVYHTGDFALCSKLRKKEIIRQLNGYKILIRGNHDAGPLHGKEIGFDEVYNWMTLSLVRADLPDKRILLIHEPTRYLKKMGDSNPFDYILCGHVHSNWKRLKNAINVGVDVWNFEPIELTTALAVFQVDLTGAWDLQIERIPEWKGSTAAQEIYSL